jgi:hypothetical protein
MKAAGQLTAEQQTWPDDLQKALNQPDNPGQP